MRVGVGVGVLGRDKSLQLILEFSNGCWATLPITFEYLHYFM